MAGGEHPDDVAASFGMHRSWAYKIQAQARGRGVVFGRCVRAKARGRPRKLTRAQEQQVLRWINGRNPMQYGFDFGLWTRNLVRELVQREFGITLSLASIGTMLARLNLTPQKPLQRTYQRNPEASERWQHDTYPAIARQARKETPTSPSRTNRASALTRCTAGPGRRAVKHPLPSVRASGKVYARRRPSTRRVPSRFATYEGGLSGELSVTLLRKLMFNRSIAARRFICSLTDCLRIRKPSSRNISPARKAN